MDPIVDSAITISQRLLRHLRRKENARIQEWVVHHVETRFVSNAKAKDTITSTIIHDFAIIIRHRLFEHLMFQQDLE